jgi:hypothetical protein
VHHNCGGRGVGYQHHCIAVCTRCSSTFATLTNDGCHVLMCSRTYCMHRSLTNDSNGLNAC